ncbi:hypothetical protein KP509_16G028500 [Ceratopteris richardii]|uniref:Uncharacterized protein n=1 Tax=Ceratopteris richardii TaxID=49495 RepID=A0A8T2SXK7_CERRI|nr:hypothetical protein KP509_16G028500 [Ceratopteris richardii]
MNKNYGTRSMTTTTRGLGKRVTITTRIGRKAATTRAVLVILTE